MNEYILVPTNLQAFVVGKPRDKVYDLARVPRNEKQLSVWYRGSHRKRIQSLDEQDKLKPLAPGVHLHWALPAALARSRSEASGPPTQPLIPNRWVVLRMWHGGGNPRGISAQAWVLESDHVSLDAATPQSTPFPFFGTNPLQNLKGMQSTPFAFHGTNPPAELAQKGLHCGYVGRAEAVPAGGWQERHEEYRFALTSLGWGDPSFASYYPACKGVLGFHDTMDGVQKDDRVSYVVLGWYSDAASDPFHGARPPDTVQECEQRLARLGWSCADLERRSAGMLPRRTLCHGSCVGIKWPGSAVTVSDKPPPVGEPTVAIGRSAAEAVAALLARDEPDRNRKALEDVLCAFQLGQATQVSSEDRLLDLLHRHSFGAVPGGTSWTLAPVAAPPQATAASTPPPPLSAKIQDLLAKLNEAQQALDRNGRLVEWKRSQLFACWAIWASGQEGLEPLKRGDVDSTLVALDQAIQGQNPMRQAVADGKARVTQALADEPPVTQARETERTRLEPADTTNPPFLHPKDPFVAVQADGLVGVDRVRPQGAPADAESLPLLECRLDSELVQAVKQLSPLSKEWLAKKVLPLQTAPGAVGTVPLLAAAHETLLFDPHSADLLFDPQSADPIPSSVQELFRQLQTSLQQSKTLSGAEMTWAGKPPDRLGVTQWDRYNPWLPVYLVWQAAWTPAYAPGQDPNTDSGPLAGWELGRAPGGGDLVRKSGAKPPKSAEVLLDGATIVAPLDCRRLARNLDDFARGTGATLLDRSKLESVLVLGQSLGGFNDLLLRHTLGLCLPPFDPTKEDRAEVDKPVWAALQQKPPPLLPLVPARPREGDPAPAAKTFLPVRAGALKLVKLHVVDCFGQTQRPIDDRPSSKPPRFVAAASLRPSTADHPVAFSPRLVQPARLNFAWLPGGEESVGPVCGWIVANYLEKSFAVFSASGESLGALESVLPAVHGETTNVPVKRFYWRPKPGSKRDLAAIKNPALRGFVSLADSLSPEDGDALLGLVELVLRRTEGRVPAEDPALSVLLGRPLALAHAALGLELDGPPAGYWTIDAQNDLKFKTDDWSKLKVPVRLGGVNLPSDGLVGYLTEPASLCASAGAVDPRLDRSRNAIRYDQDLFVTSAELKPVTLLMDAGAPVHATTGLLPRHRASLPAEAARYASLIEEFYVGVAPVLGERPRQVAAEQPTVTMPRPSDAFGQWSWATRPDITSWHEIRPADDRARFADGVALAEGQLRLQVKPGATTPR